MNEYVVADTVDAGPGVLTAREVEGEQIAIANVGGRYYAFSNICTHAECELADGELNGTSISCPCHFGEFDVVTGAALRAPASVPLRVFDVRREGTRLLVALPSAPVKG